MRSDRKLDPKAEIGHVLLIDIVGYSELLINGPRDQINCRNEHYYGTNTITAEQAGALTLKAALS